MSKTSTPIWHPLKVPFSPGLTLSKHDRERKRETPKMCTGTLPWQVPQSLLLQAPAAAVIGHHNQPRPHYLTEQREINAKMRAILVDWLVEAQVDKVFIP